MEQKKLHKKRLVRANRVRYKTKLKSNGKLRVSVFKSLNQVYAQIIDDVAGKTLLSSSTLLLKESVGDKKAAAKWVGVELAKKAQEAGIIEAYFDRGRFLYHGRIVALAEGLREGGLKI